MSRWKKKIFKTSIRSKLLNVPHPLTLAAEERTHCIKKKHNWNYFSYKKIISIFFKRNINAILTKIKYWICGIHYRTTKMKSGFYRPGSLYVLSPPQSQIRNRLLHSLLSQNTWKRWTIHLPFSCLFIYTSGEYRKKTVTCIQKGVY